MEDTGQSLTIGSVAKAAEVGVETIRFYEREGLIAEPPRRASGYRQYPPQTVRRVRFIRRAKDLGFTLKEVGELLSLRVDPSTACPDVREMTRAKIQHIEQRIAELSRMREVLERLARACRGRGPTSECPILDLLDQE
ncbi:MAG: MerR family DNA-binding protein [Myxococcales bacterium]|nr:MerR family DNA-binding protein [Myxococcales bacterium]